MFTILFLSVNLFLFSQNFQYSYQRVDSVYIKNNTAYGLKNNTVITSLSPVTNISFFIATSNSYNVTRHNGGVLVTLNGNKQLFYGGNSNVITNDNLISFGIKDGTVIIGNDNNAVRRAAQGNSSRLFKYSM